MNEDFIIGTWERELADGYAILTLCDDVYIQPYCHQYCLSYKLEFTDSSGNESVIFEGSDYGCSPMVRTDSDASAGGVMTFLSLRLGDTDDEYFEKYSPEQLAFAEKYGDDLSYWAEDLETEEES